MPRSLHHCLDKVDYMLSLVANKQSAETCRRSGLLHARLHYARTEDILAGGLHEYLTDFMKQGAVEFLEKPFKDQALLDAIAQAVRRSVAETSQQDAWKAARERFFSLTEREREVAVGLARGWSYKAIARAMGISDKTVQAHRNHLVEKLDLRSAAELAQLIMKIAPELLAES